MVVRAGVGVEVSVSKSFERVLKEWEVRKVWWFWRRDFTFWGGGWLAGKGGKSVKKGRGKGEKWRAGG
jgi:hypothetical protein